MGMGFAVGWGMLPLLEVAEHVSCYGINGSGGDGVGMGSGWGVGTIT